MKKLKQLGLKLETLNEVLEQYYDIAQAPIKPKDKLEAFLNIIVSFKLELESQMNHMTAPDDPMKTLSRFYLMRRSRPNEINEVWSAHRHDSEEEIGVVYYRPSEMQGWRFELKKGENKTIENHYGSKQEALLAMVMHMESDPLTSNNMTDHTKHMEDVQCLHGELKGEPIKALGVFINPMHINNGITVFVAIAREVEETLGFIWEHQNKFYFRLAVNPDFSSITEKDLIPNQNQPSFHSLQNCAIALVTKWGAKERKTESTKEAAFKPDMEQLVLLGQLMVVAATEAIQARAEGKKEGEYWETFGFNPHFVADIDTMISKLSPAGLLTVASLRVGGYTLSEFIKHTQNRLGMNSDEETLAAKKGILKEKQDAFRDHYKSSAENPNIHLQKLKKDLDDGLVESVMGNTDTPAGDTALLTDSAKRIIELENELAEKNTIISGKLKAQFEGRCFTFGKAIQLLKAGHRVTRKGHEEMFVAMGDARVQGFNNAEVLMVLDGSIIEAFSPSNSDIMANDWMLYGVRKVGKKTPPKPTFDFVSMSDKLKEGKRMRRESWIDGKYLFISQKNPNLIRVKSSGLSAHCYSATQDELDALDWVETKAN